MALFVFRTPRLPLVGGGADEIVLRDAMAAVYAAEARARVCGEPCVAATADRVELLEAVMALPCAWGDRIPLVVVNRVSTLEIDFALRTYHEVTRRQLAVRHRDDLPGLARRVSQALEFDAPVQVVAVDALAIEALAAVVGAAPPNPVLLPPDPRAVHRIACKLEAALHPLLVVGRRAALAVTPSRVAALAERILAPVALTIDASSLPLERLALWKKAFEKGPLLLPAANVAWIQSFLGSDAALILDAILSEGDLFFLNDFALPPENSLAWVGREDLGSAQLVPAPAYADPEAFLESLGATIDEPGPIRRRLRRHWIHSVRGSLEILREETDRYADEDAKQCTIEPTFASRSIVKGRPPGTVLLTEGNGCGMWIWSYLGVERVVHPGLMANIGITLAWLVGVTSANPDAPVWAVIGDGSLLYQLRMLSEIARLHEQEQLRGPMVTFVFSNCAWDSIRLEQTFFFEGRYTGTSIPRYDFAALAQLSGWESRRVTKPSEIAEAVDAAARRQPGDPPLLLDIEVSRDRVPFAGLPFALAELDFIVSRMLLSMGKSLARLARRGEIPKRIPELMGKLIWPRSDQQAGPSDAGAVTSGGESLLRALAARHVRHVFSIPGAQLLSVWDAFRHVEGIELVVPHSEWNGGLMAEGYGKVAGVPAVVMNTVGPGVGNEVVAMESARASGTPVLYVSPCQPGRQIPGSLQPRRDKRARLGSVLQGIAQSQHLREHVVRDFALESLSDLDSTLAEAFEAAKRGPVRIDVSFPLLFDVVPLFPPESVPSPSVPALAGVLIAEAGGKEGGWYELLFPEKDGVRTAPGIEREGHGIPFALGARIARPEVPMALVTSAGALMDGLDCVGLARSLGIEVHIVEMETKSGQPLRDAARIFGAKHHLRPSVSQVRQLVHGEPKAWTIVCDRV